MPGRLIKRVLVVALASVVFLAGLRVGGVRLIDSSGRIRRVETAWPACCGAAR